MKNFLVEQERIYRLKRFQELLKLMNFRDLAPNKTVQFNISSEIIGGEWVPVAELVLNNLAAVFQNIRTFVLRETPERFLLMNFRLGSGEVHYSQNIQYGPRSFWLDKDGSLTVLDTYASMGSASWDERARWKDSQIEYLMVEEDEYRD